MAMNRIESGNNIKFNNIYLLDLIKFRSISNQISNQFNVIHESPQILKIVKGKCVYHTSHQDINWGNIPD